MSGGGGDTQTTRIENPPWMDAASQGLLGSASGAVNGAQWNPLQTGAFAGAGMWGQMAPGALGQSYNVMTDNANYQANPDWLGPLAGLLAGGGSSFGAGGGAIRGTASGHDRGAAQAQTSTIDMSQLQQLDPRSVLDYNVNDYMNPFTQGVIDTQAGDIERSRQLQQRNDAAQQIGQGAFGGSRSAIQSAVTNGEFDRNQMANSANLRNAAYGNAMGLIQGDITNANAADAANQAQWFQGLLANAGFENAGSQFNAGQTNNITQANISADAQRAAAAYGANASMYAAGLNARNNQLSTLVNGALGLGQLGLGADLNAATLRGNTAQQLAAFGQNGLGAMGGAGNQIYGQPFDDLGWYSGVLGNVPHGQSSSQPIYHNRGAGALGGAMAGASMGSSFGPWGTAIGALGGGAMGYFGG